MFFFSLFLNTYRKHPGFSAWVIIYRRALSLSSSFTLCRFLLVKLWQVCLTAHPNLSSPSYQTHQSTPYHPTQAFSPHFCIDANAALSSASRDSFSSHTSAMWSYSSEVNGDRDTSEKKENEAHGLNITIIITTIINYSNNAHKLRPLL